LRLLTGKTLSYSLDTSKARARERGGEGEKVERGEERGGRER